MSWSDSPARSRALWTAGTGPMPISSGLTPATAIARILAIGFKPRSFALSSDMISSATAPTLIGELFPAVTDPPAGLNAGGSAPSTSSEVSRRMHWSCVIRTFWPDSLRPQVGTTSFLNNP